MERPIVATGDGKVQGIALKSVLGHHYLGFRGIPYAQPPLGPLRFKEPQPPVKWSGIRDASKFAGGWALQKETVGEPPFGVCGTEDCLYLNVYTKSLIQKKPVMFYIHGGACVEGNGNDLYKEDYFISADVVLVFVNFRLGPLGFLNLGHEVAPGNQGIRDVIFSLKWVQRNIEAFGGDSNNVTIFGNSSGSSMAHLFTLIPATKGLFHKAILQSGSLFMSTCHFVKDKSEFKNGFKIASLLGMNSNDPEEVIEFLRSVPAKKLVELEGKILPTEMTMGKGMREYEPIYDAEYTTNPVIPIPIPNLLKKKTDIPIIVGHTKDEYLLMFIGKADDEENYKKYSDYLERYIGSKLFLNDPKKLAEVMEFIRENYLKNKPINKENAWNLIELLGDFMIAINEKLIDVRNENGDAPTYVYMYSHEGNEPTFYQYDQGPQPFHGVAHADELSYMFYFEYMKLDKEEKDRFPKEGTKDRNVIERFVRMWANFAATGNPTPKLDDRYVTTAWKPSSKEHLYYLDINEELTLRDRRDKSDPKGHLYEKIKGFMNYK